MLALARAMSPPLSPKDPPGPLRRAALRLSVPLLRSSPPWLAVRAYARLAGESFYSHGGSGRTATLRLRPHGLPVELFLDDWSERLAYHCGRYYDLEGTAVVEALLGSGDAFVDVGCNVGMLALTAAVQVGERGLVIAFDPNPQLCERLRETCRANGLARVVVENVALGAEPGAADLSLAEHTGTGTLRGRKGQRSIPTAVRTLDEFLERVPPGAFALVKLDVEGYEGMVLRGARAFLRRPGTGALVEVTDSWLRETGSSADELFDTLAAGGFSLYRPSVGPSSRLSLTPLARPLEGVAQYDVVGLRPSERDAWAARLRRAGVRLPAG